MIDAKHKIWNGGKRQTAKIYDRAKLREGNVIQGPAIVTEFNRRTDEVPSGKIEWQPRLGFNWDVNGDERNQLRAGAGVAC